MRSKKLTKIIENSFWVNPRSLVRLLENTNFELFWCSVPASGTLRFPSNESNLIPNPYFSQKIKVIVTAKLCSINQRCRKKLKRDSIQYCLGLFYTATGVLGVLPTSLYDLVMNSAWLVCPGTIVASPSCFFMHFSRSGQNNLIWQPC